MVGDHEYYNHSRHWGEASRVSPKEALAFVERHGIVLAAARGPVPSLAEAIGGGPIRGSWWGHPKGHEIFAATEAIQDCDDVLVCKLIDGKVTYIHRRLWPALVKLAGRFRKGPLARVWNEHTERGSHRTRRLEFPDWVPPEVAAEAAALSEAQAEEILGPLLRYGRSSAEGERAKAAFRAAPRARARAGKGRGPAARGRGKA
jgi:hypothetical protein